MIHFSVFLIAAGMWELSLFAIFFNDKFLRDRFRPNTSILKNAKALLPKMKLHFYMFSDSVNFWFFF